MRCFHVRMVPESAEEGTIVRVLCVIRDITRIRNAESALRDLVAHHTTVIEQQRKHIAREVHDELGQVLTALKTELALTGMRMAGGDSNELRDRIAIMQDLSNCAIQTVQNVTRALRPATLDLGIVNAIDWLGRDFERRTGVHCVLNLPEEELELVDALAIDLFRIVQEALTNVERHADAGTVEVTLRCSDRGIHLSVLDDGVGFAAEELAPQASFGLQSGREQQCGTDKVRAGKRDWDGGCGWLKHNQRRLSGRSGLVLREATGKWPVFQSVEHLQVAVQFRPFEIGDVFPEAINP